MNKEYRSFIEKLDRGLQEELGSPNISICVFLLGPGDSDNSQGRLLREYLKRKCEEFGVVVKGEHKELIRIFNNRTGGLLNLCHLENWFASRHANAVVMIPYSAGSLVEMGMFTWKPTICRKTMLIFSNEFPESEDSFINRGTRIHYRSKGATVTCVDYSKKQQVWKEVKSFLSKYKAEKLEEVLLR